MMYPSWLHLPSIIGAIVGVVLAIALWSFQPYVAILVGLGCLLFGFWSGVFIAKRFFESLEKKER